MNSTIGKLLISDYYDYLSMISFTLFLFIASWQLIPGESERPCYTKCYKTLLDTEGQISACSTIFHRPPLGYASGN